MLNRLASKIGPTFNISHATDYKRNLVKVEIYFEDFLVNLIQERAAYTVMVRITHTHRHTHTNTHRHTHTYRDICVL